MTNAGEHIINRTATAEHYRTYFTHNPITHAQAIEQDLVPIDPRTSRPTAAYTKGRQLAEQAKWRNPSIYGSEQDSPQNSGTFFLRAKGLATRFNAISNAAPIVIDTPSAFQPDIKAAIKSVREQYRELQNNPVTMKDGKVVRFSNAGFHEIKRHAADRRVIAVMPQLREICESAEFMYSADNSEPEKQSKQDIRQYHYYLNKASFSGRANDAYILIAVAERTNGEFFYDLDATDIETIDNIKGTTDTLAATRVPNTGRQGGAPKGRLHNLKEVVNNIEQNLPITATQAAPLFQDGVMQASNAIITQPTASLSLRRSPDLNASALLNERETTLARVSNYIKREADRTANIMGRDTELQRAGVAFAQANAIINALDTYIFSKDYITKGSAEYRRLRNLRHFINEYITVARKGKLPVRRNTKPPLAPHRTGEPPSLPTGRSGREYQYEAAYMAMLLMMKPHRLIRAAYRRFFQGRKTACPATMEESS